MNKPSYISPYLSFNNNCRQAMEFYHSIFGGNLDISTFGDFENDGLSNDDKLLVMHAVLQSDTLTFMASDKAPDADNVVFGNCVSMLIAGDNQKELSGFFDALAEGGRIVTPLAQQVWGDIFGMCTDRFGIPWMVNISMSHPQGRESL